MDNNKIIQQISKLLEKTKERKLPWKSVGANAIRWVKQEDNRLFTITLQMQLLGGGQLRTLNQPRSKTFTLTIQATSPNEIILQINSNRDAYSYEIMQQLFEEASLASTEGSSDIIDKLLGDL